MIVTEGTLLGGRLRYRQSASGHRTGIEPVLLAAAIPARPGERVIEAGTGAGAGLLCLGHRVAGLAGVGVERDPALAGLAAANFHANGLDGIGAVAADIARLPLAVGFHHAFANPPWRDVADTASPDPGRRLAHRAPAGLLAAWVGALAAVLRARGSITLILPASSLSDTCAVLRDAGCGACRVLPLWPRAGRAAKLVIVQARKGARGPDALLPGLILHGATGYTGEAEAILRDGTALVL
ncbi:tRNA1(Val) (adenine(37)-N6)-methyltransferase [Acidiphilium iwatense]|uniref:SAM-dependent methyltransferase n=1 Tax=Acidiphilium iwatense TaxID=768198 RepID=A0ABS9DSP3_9PROT|nr:SAM-dependent methyltransferase [Acidiphilium iwatense]MCF3945684.1 SAM-dependent methyltransferase [Acidiphilium iwatense]